MHESKHCSRLHLGYAFDYSSPQAKCTMFLVEHYLAHTFDLANANKFPYADINTQLLCNLIGKWKDFNLALHTGSYVTLLTNLPCPFINSLCIASFVLKFSDPVTIIYYVLAPSFLKHSILKSLYSFAETQQLGA